MPEDRARQVGDLAVRRGLITPEQLDEALREFRRRRTAGSHVPLGEMMVAMGHITRNQLEYLLEAQGGKRGPAQQIAGFELIRKLGEGGMGAVYLARQVSMDRLVALKVLRPQLSRDPAYVDRFMREARLAGQLDHENVVSAIGAGEAGGFHYLAMEYVEGRSLGETMPDGGLPEVFALQLMLQVARGLDHAHRHGIIHRDIKPDNILITGKGVAKLADLGLAKQAEAGTRLTQTGMAVGTADYMSPEQARGVGEADIRSDVYSLGATLYHLVTGRPPFDGPNALVVLNKHISEQAPWPQDVNPAVSKGCCLLIARMMAKEPTDRYQEPAELIADLELVIDGKEPGGTASAMGRSSLGASGTVQVVPVMRPRLSRKRRDTRLEPAEQSAGERLAAAMKRRVAVSVPMLVGASAGLLLTTMIAGLLLRGCGGGAGAVADVGARVSSEPTFPPPMEPAVDETALRTGLAEAEAFRQRSPDDYAGAIALLEKVCLKGRGTRWESEAGKAMVAVKAEQDAAAERELVRLKDEARKLAEAGNYDGGILVLAKPSEKFAGLLANKITAEQAALRQRAEAHLGTTLAAAEQFSEDGQPERGLAELDKAATLKYAAGNERLKVLRARLATEKASVAATAERKLKADAARALAAILDGFTERLLAGESRKAAEHLTAEKGKLGRDALGLVAAELGAAEKVAGEVLAFEASRKRALDALVGKEVSLVDADSLPHRVTIIGVKADAFAVERSYVVGGAPRKKAYDLKFVELAAGQMERLVPAFRPEGLDGRMAAAAMAVQRRDFAEAERALALAEQHVLAERCRKKLDALKSSAQEAAAEEAWGSQIQKLARGQYTAERGQALLAALDAYLNAHGGTNFARGKAEEAGRLRSGVLEAAAEEAWEKQVGKLVQARYTPAQGQAMVTALNAFLTAHGGTDFAKGKTDEAAKLRSAARLAYEPEVYAKFPFDAAEARRRQEETARKLGLPVEKALDLGGGMKLAVVLIPAGEFTMGAPEAEESSEKRERPAHRVRITRPYYIGKYEVTQEQWERVTGKNPSFFKGKSRFPVEQLSWHDCQDFVKKLTELFKDEVEFRLPTEAQWEHACRAGTDTPYWLGEKLAPDLARYDSKGTGRGSTVLAGSYRPNAWGLYDTTGNVMEWCANGYYGFSKEDQVNPEGPKVSAIRMVRGGSCASSPAECRSACRRAYESSDPKKTYNLTGLRVLATIPLPEPEPPPVAAPGPKAGR